MLACVYPAENFKSSKTVTVKLRHGRSRRKPKLLSVKEKLPDCKEPDANENARFENELPVGGGGAVLVLSELESMAARQQREIAQQRRLLEQKEARLAVLRGAQEPAQQDKLARLRHRLDQQQSKLNRLRLLRSQTDQSRANNATLTSDLDCIRALFNEKEKELSLAVAKVEELTRQLEELRGRQNGGGTGTGIGGGGGVAGTGPGGISAGHLPAPASAELEKLRRELMYRNKMNEQQNQVVSQQRLALAQRQAEMASIDARIAQLQGRLQRKRALNQRLSQQLGSTNRTNATTNTGFPESKLDFNAGGKARPTGNIAAIEPYSHIPNDNDFNLNKNDPKYQTLPYNTKFTVNFKAVEDDVNKNKIQHSASASQLGQRTAFQQFGHQIAHSQSQSHIQGRNNNLIASTHNNFTQETLSQNFRIHAHPQQSSQLQQQQQQQSQHGNTQTKQYNSTSSSTSSLGSAPSITQAHNHRNLQTHQKPVSSVAPSFPVKSLIYQTSSTKINPVMPQTLSLIGRAHSTTQNFVGLSGSNNNSQQQANQTGQGNVGSTQEPNYSSRHNYGSNQQQPQQQQQQQQQHGTGQTNAHVSSSTIYQAQNSPNLVASVHATPNVTTLTGNTNVQRYNQNQSESQNDNKNKFEPTKVQDKFEHVLPSKHEQQQQQQQQQQQIRYEGNLFKYDSQQMKYDQQVNQPSKMYEQSVKHDQKHENRQSKHEQHHNAKYDSGQSSQQYKHDQHENRNSVKYEQHSGGGGGGGGGGNPSFKHEVTNNPQQFKQEQTKYESGQNKFESTSSKYEQNTTIKHDHNVKFEPPSKLSEKPFEFERLKNENERKNLNELRTEDKIKPALPPKPSKPNPPPRLTHHDKIDVTSDGLNDCKTAVVVSIGSRTEKEEDIPPIPTSEPPESPTDSQLKESDIIDALNIINIEDKPKLKSDTERRLELDIDVKTSEVMRRKKGNLKSSTGKANLSRRVSFDPLALLLDASLEGELELVKKTAKEVANPSSANDEGITALHNAICAGHLEIVKFLVEFGCDVNAQDSDGWTPLHCAASCNNLSMVRFLVEHGACIFATTLSDHETAAEKCEEDEEGFDGCSEYLYSVQEKLGIMNNGQVYAVFDYEAQHSDELSLKNGDSLVVLRKGDDNEREWWWSKLGHKEGYVPRNLLGLYPRVQPTKTD
ncbi:hypothetical protein M0802_003858 [Mischocyttarus mexicanus]|nr:hypothetical protein M0802_003858 [Mischocyttarus mexicanus]